MTFTEILEILFKWDWRNIFENYETKNLIFSFSFKSFSKVIVCTFIFHFIRKWKFVFIFNLKQLFLFFIFFSKYKLQIKIVFFLFFSIFFVEQITYLFFSLSS